MSRVIPFKSKGNEVNVSSGMGQSLGDISEINAGIVSCGKNVLNELHLLLFNYNCVIQITRRNLLQFCGFTYQKEDFEKKRKLLMSKKLTNLRNYCILFGLHHGGSKSDLTMRVLEFLMNPKKKDTQDRLENILTSTSSKPEIDPIETPAATHISVLPPELLSRIFGYLGLGTRGRLSTVCREWRDTVYHPSLWRKSVAKWRLSRNNPTLVPSLLQRRVPKVDVYSFAQRHILRLDISNPRELIIYESMGNNCLRVVLEPFMEFLESLNVVLAGNNDPTILEVIGNIPALKKLHLRQCHMISNEALQLYFDSKPALEDLQLHEFRMVSAESGLVSRIALPTIKRLNLTGCKISEEDVKNISDLEQLEELFLNSSNFNFNHLGISYLVKGNAKIVTLELKSCTGLQDHHLSGLGRMTHLRSLNLSGNEITDACFYTLVSARSNIATLNISDCKLITDAGLKCLASLTELRELNLSNCRLITSIGLSYLANDRSRITGLTVKCCEHIYSFCQSLIKKGVFQLITIREQSRILGHVLVSPSIFGGDENGDSSRFLAIIKVC